MDRNRVLPRRHSSIERTVLVGYITTEMARSTAPFPAARTAYGDRPRWRGRGRALVRDYPRETVGLGRARFRRGRRRRQHDDPQRGDEPGSEGGAPRPAANDPQRRTGAGAEGQCRNPVTAAPTPRPLRSPSRAAERARQALNCLASAVYYEAGNQDADGERAVAQVSSTACVTRLSPTASAESSTRDRRAPPAASSPSPATDRSPASRTPTAGAAPGRSPRTRSRVTSMRPLAGRPIITPICPPDLGFQAWQRMRSSARIFSTAGPAAGVSQRRSAILIPGVRRRRWRSGTAAPLSRRARSRPAGPIRNQGYPRRGAPEARRPRCAATSALPSASTLPRGRPRGGVAAEDYTKKFELSDNLKYALSSDKR